MGEDVGDGASDVIVVQRRDRLHPGTGEGMGAREWRIDQTRLDEGYAHTRADRLLAQGVAQSDDRPLAGAVDRLADVGFAARDGGHHDDVPVAAFEHAWQSRAHRVGDAEDIRLDDIAPMVGIAVGHGAGVADPGVGDSEINLVEAFQARIAQAFAVGVAADVGLDGNRITAGRGDGGDGGGKVSVVAIGEGQSCAEARQLAGDGGADAATGAGDDACCAFQPLGHDRRILTLCPPRLACRARGMRVCIERQHLLAMAHGAADAGEDSVVGQFEGVKELDDDGHVGQTGVADGLGEGGDVVKAAVVGPAPVGIALEVVVLQMKEGDVVPQGVEPVDQVDVFTIERAIEGVADVEHPADGDGGAIAKIAGQPLRFGDGVRNLARQRGRFDEERLQPGGRGGLTGRHDVVEHGGVPLGAQGSIVGLGDAQGAERSADGGSADLRGGFGGAPPPFAGDCSPGRIGVKQTVVGVPGQTKLRAVDGETGVRGGAAYARRQGAALALWPPGIEQVEGELDEVEPEVIAHDREPSAPALASV